jgi:tetratricopeptide (TPR) repeat protein
MRPLVAVLIAVCALTAVTVPSHGQQAPGSPPLPFPASAWRAIGHGRVSEAEALAAARPAGDVNAAAILGHLLIRKGRYDEAIALLEPVAARNPQSDAALELGLLQKHLGRRQAASQLLTSIFRQASNARDAAALLRAARAARALDDPRSANDLFRAASAAAADDPAPQTGWGQLFFQKHDPAEAGKSFQIALKIDPDWAPAHVGFARALSESNPPAAAKSATRALEIDSTLADAELLLAELDLDNTRYDAARERISRVLAENPSNLEAHALAAAIVYVREGRGAFDAAARKVLSINSGYGEVYRVAAALTARNYRFDEAVALARESLTLDPTSAKAAGDLGMYLLRTGDEPEARRALERSFRGDAYDNLTFNLLKMLDKLDKFQVFREGDIILKLQEDEAPVMRDYAMPLAQEALRTLSAKYEFTPKGPILVEMFPVHDDFAVRTLGLPGMVGALGACFGRVVTLDSPRAAQKPGSFSWQATLWHEMAHVITLQMSNQRVPRWLTEGISVYEEAKAKPEWGRDMEVPFAAALERGKALKLKDLNSGFTSPETIALAYFESSLLVDHIVSTHGEAKLRALVKSYGEGLEGDAAVEKTIGGSIGDLQASFDKALDARFGALRTALRELPPGTLPAGGQGADLAMLKAAADANPGNYGVQLALGQVLAAAGDKAAFEPLERAAKLVPVATGDDSPHAIMGKLAEQLGDPARAIREYEALLAQDHTSLEPARRLAALVEKTGPRESLMRAYDRVVALYPFDSEAHSGLGRVAMSAKDAKTAVREFKAALATGPADKAAAHCDLGEAYLLAGQVAEAKKEALTALEIAPTFDRAQDLLLRTIRANAPNGAAR